MYVYYASVYIIYMNYSCFHNKIKEKNMVFYNK